MTNILLVEDNIELAHLIQAFLKKEGFLCYCTTSGEEAKRYLLNHQVQIILLDIMLPGIDGFAFCQFIRQTSQVPIFIMSARSTKSDQLLGFELGADDYIEKPVDIDILCAKICAVLSRSKKRHISTIITSGAIAIDSSARQVYLHNQLLDINVKEYELLLLFIENTGKTLHKDFLFNTIWGMDSMSENQTLTVHIKMLRSKIEQVDSDAKRIITVWGVGYRYEEV